MVGFTQDVKKKPEIKCKVELFDFGANGKYVYLPRPLRFYIVNVLGISDAGSRNYSRNELLVEDEMELYEIKVDLSVSLDVLLVLAPEMMRLHNLRTHHNLQANSTGGEANPFAEEISQFKELFELLEKESNSESLREEDKSKTSIGKLYKLLNQPGKEWVTRDPYADIVFKSCNARIIKTTTGTIFSVTGDVRIVERGKLVSRSVEFQFPYFVGLKPWSEIGLCLLDPTHEKYGYYMERGRKVVQVSENPSYMMYDGSLVRRLPFGDRKFKAKGRVMIDKLGMRESDVNYSSYFGESDHRNMLLSLDREEENLGIKLSEVPPDEFRCVIPFIYGFSFVSKVWGEMLIDNIRPIQFREETFEHLVLDKDTKDLLLTLVENSEERGLDFIDGKGGGLIFLLNGATGVGKTLTAEAVAEKLHRPLYIVGVGELGTTTAELEDKLRLILDTAAAWNAVLLIDECDIFMEERSDNNIERNAMVGIFLRLLEYYEGVLFLTSNRAHKIDEAFYSRISLSIHYPNLSEENRRQIWRGLLDLYGMKDIDETVLSKYDMNGRHIKGVLRIISAVSKPKGKPPTTEDFINIIQKEQAFKRFANAPSQYTLNI